MSDSTNVSCTVSLPSLSSGVEKTPKRVDPRSLIPNKDSPESLKREIQNTKQQNKLLAALKKTKVEQAETKIIRNLPNIVQKVIEQSLAGDLQASKILLDRVLPVLKAGENEGTGKSTGGFNISINVSGNSEVILGKSDKKDDLEEEDILEGEIIDG